MNLNPSLNLNRNRDRETDLGRDESTRKKTSQARSRVFENRHDHYRYRQRFAFGFVFVFVFFVVFARAAATATSAARTAPGRYFHFGELSFIFPAGTVSSPTVFTFHPMSLKTKISAGLGLFATAVSFATFPIADAAVQTAPAVSKNVRTYVAPNGKGYVIVLLKNGKYSFKQKGGKVSARTFTTSSAALRFVAANNKKTAAASVAAPVATPVETQIQTPAPVTAPVVAPTPVYVALADTSTRAS